MRPTWSSLILLLAGVALGGWTKHWLRTEPPTPAATVVKRSVVVKPGDTETPPEEGPFDYAAWEDLVRQDPAAAWKRLAAMPGPLRWLARKRFVETLAMSRPDEVGAWMDLLVPGERDQALGWAFTALQAAHGEARAGEVMLTWKKSHLLPAEPALVAMGRASPERAWDILHGDMKFNDKEREALARGLASGWLERDPAQGLARLAEFWKTNPLPGLLSPDLTPEGLAKVWTAFAEVPAGPFRDELQEALRHELREKLPVEFLRDCVKRGEKVDVGRLMLSALKDYSKTNPPSLELWKLCEAVAVNSETWGEKNTYSNTAQDLFAGWAHINPDSTWALWQELPPTGVKKVLWETVAVAKAAKSPWVVSEQIRLNPELGSPKVLGAIGAGLVAENPAVARAWCQQHPQAAEGTVRATMLESPDAAFALMQEFPQGITGDLLWDFSTDLMKRDPLWALSWMTENEGKTGDHTAYKLLEHWNDTAGKLAWLKSAKRGEAWDYAFLDLTRTKRQKSLNPEELVALSVEVKSDHVRSSFQISVLASKFRESFENFDSWLNEKGFGETTRAEWIAAKEEIEKWKKKKP